MLLYDALQDTAHDVVACHYREDYNPTFRKLSAMGTLALGQVVPWLKSNAREFTFEAVAPRKADAKGVKFDKDALDKVRAGFAEVRGYHWMRCRYATHGHEAQRSAPDELWTGLTTWNREAAWLLHGDAIYQAFTTKPMKRPFRDGNLGRLSIIRKLPAALRPMIVKCYTGGGADCECSNCLSYRFYDAICADLNAATILKLERRLEQLGKFGRSAATADPVTYRRAAFDDLIRPDQDAKWKAWLKRQK